MNRIIISFETIGHGYMKSNMWSHGFLVKLRSGTRIQGNAGGYFKDNF